MKNKTLHIDDETITVTKHGENDYSIAFDVFDYSVRGTLLDVVKAFAEWQVCTVDSTPLPAVYFDDDDSDVTICNPWTDRTGRFDLDDTQAIETYGVDNVLKFIMDATALLRPDID